MAQKVPSDSNKLLGPYKAFWGRYTSKGKWEIKMWMAYVCEAPYIRQIQIRTARDLQKGRNRMKGDMTAVQRLMKRLARHHTTCDSSRTGTSFSCA